MLERYGHGGDLLTAEEAYGLSRNEFIDFSSNMNPFGPPAVVRELFRNRWQDVTRYPDPAVRELRRKISLIYDIPMESILVGNGAAELIDLAVRVLQPKVTAILRPSFSEYEEAVHKTGGQLLELTTTAESGFQLQGEQAERALNQADLMFLGHPNNPTGKLISPLLLKQLAASGTPLILDEAFIDFLQDEEQVTFIREAAMSKHLLVIRSMTKFYAIPGIRLGFIVAHPDTIARLRFLQVQWSVNFLAQLIGTAVLDEREYAQRTKVWLVEERAWLTSALEQSGLTVYPSDTNFLLFSFPSGSGLTIGRVQQNLGKRGILVRDASLFKGLDSSFCRVAIRLRADNEKLVAALKLAFAELGTGPNGSER